MIKTRRLRRIRNKVLTISKKSIVCCFALPMNEFTTKGVYKSNRFFKKEEFY
jgi:hypothetical protein